MISFKESLTEEDLRIFSSSNTNVDMCRHDMCMRHVQRRVPVFDGKGDVNIFIFRIESHIKVKKLEGEDAAILLASRLEEPAFNVYMHLSTDDKKDVEKIKKELRGQYQTTRKIHRRSCYAPIAKKKFSLRDIGAAWLATLLMR